MSRSPAASARVRAARGQIAQALREADLTGASVQVERAYDF